MIDPDCPECGGDGWVEDESACDDREHCHGWRSCRCNPECEPSPEGQERGRR